MGLAISKRYFYIFIQFQPDFMKTLATMVEYMPLLFLAIGQLKINNFAV